MDIDEYRTRVGISVGLAVAALIAVLMWLGGGAEFSSRRYSVLLLLLIGAAPPVIAGVIAGAAAALLIGDPLYHMAEARKYRRALERGDVGGLAQARRTIGVSVAAPLDGASRNTALHVAALKGQGALIEALVEMADHWPQRNRAGRTFLEVAPPEHALAVRRAFCRAYGGAVLRALGWDLRELGTPEATRDLFARFAERYIARFDDATDFDALDWIPEAREAAKIFIEIGASLSDAGNLDVALAAENAAIRLDPANALAYLRRCVTFSRKGELQRALADANRAVRLDPASALALEARGAVHDDLGHQAEAIADYTKALELDSQASCRERLNQLIAAWLRR